MRLRLSHLLTAGLLVCAGPARAAPPAGPEPEAKPPAPEIVLANHRAVYDLSLAEGGGTRSVESARGRIVIDFRGDACRGYTMQTRQVTELSSGETGLLFPETYALWRRLEHRYGLKIRAVRPELSLGSQAALHGDALWERAPDRCCEVRKVAPLRRALAGFDAWVTSIRRAQTSERVRHRRLGQPEARSGRRDAALAQYRVEHPQQVEVESREVRHSRR